MNKSSMYLVPVLVVSLLILLSFPVFDHVKDSGNFTDPIVYYDNWTNTYSVESYEDYEDQDTTDTFFYYESSSKVDVDYSDVAYSGDYSINISTDGKESYSSDVLVSDYLWNNTSSKVSFAFSPVSGSDYHTGYFQAGITHMNSSDYGLYNSYITMNYDKEIVFGSEVNYDKEIVFESVGGGSEVLVDNYNTSMWYNISLSIVNSSWVKGTLYNESGLISESVIESGYEGDLKDGFRLYLNNTDYTYYSVLVDNWEASRVISVDKSDKVVEYNESTGYRILSRNVFGYVSNIMLFLVLGGLLVGFISIVGGS